MTFATQLAQSRADFTKGMQDARHPSPEHHRDAPLASSESPSYWLGHAEGMREVVALQRFVRRRDRRESTPT
jgi:hypothetical protein